MRFQQSYTVAAASLTGFATAVTGAAFTLSVLTPGDSLSHQVTVRNNSITNHSAKTILLTGTGANGNVLTETINAPAGSATVTSTKYFKTLVSVVPSATIGADTFDIGWTATAHSPWVMIETNQKLIGAAVGVRVGGTINYDVQYTFQTDPNENTTGYTSAALVGKTASQYEGLSIPFAAARLNVNSHTSGTAAFEVVH